jgi:hypothetical protein
MQTAATRGRCKVMLRSMVEHPAAPLNAKSLETLQRAPAEGDAALATGNSVCEGGGDVFAGTARRRERVEADHMSTLDTVNNLGLLYAA